jgi:hypothetical protein
MMEVGGWVVVGCSGLIPVLITVVRQGRKVRSADRAGLGVRG